MENISQFVTYIASILKDIAWSKKWETSLGVIIVTVWSTVTNPQGAINQFMIHVVDVVFKHLPETPDNYKLATILSDFAASNTTIGWGLIWEIIQVPMGLLAMFLVIKLIQFVKP